MSKLTAKQARFVTEYLVDLNATQAAIRAGYSPKTARVIGAENLTKPDVAAAVAIGQKVRSERVELTQDWVVEQLRENVKRSMSELEYNGSVANGALQLIGKHLGMFVDRSEINYTDMTPEQREARVLQLLSNAKERKSA